MRKHIRFIALLLSVLISMQCFVYAENGLNRYDYKIQNITFGSNNKDEGKIIVPEPTKKPSVDITE